MNSGTLCVSTLSHEQHRQLSIDEQEERLVSLKISSHRRLEYTCFLEPLSFPRLNISERPERKSTLCVGAMPANLWGLFQSLMTHLLETRRSMFRGGCTLAGQKIHIEVQELGLLRLEENEDSRTPMQWTMSNLAVALRCWTSVSACMMIPRYDTVEQLATGIPSLG
ncbi:hypothetical protein K402DRAFT_181819 [Aulographum hederae CBS 113979]|uniref:Uncharacterized protein n=1 Tax=Aulographum hederae CBS 113979 TaxID=1176131 RepID=A0A6G1GQH2_9PEZI|nr:hypothetical protein K402DRAFT_181819 [Aulographum hederae CBS 113979]